MPELWQSLFERHFVGVGWRWTLRRNKDSAPCVRGGWKVAPAIQSVQIHLSRSPTQHERLEAHLFLREWLRDKLPPNEIETLLR